MDRLAAVFEQASRSSGASTKTQKALQFVEVASSTEATQRLVPPGVKSGVYGKIAGKNDFEINLVPPELGTLDVQEQLDGVMEIEEATVVGPGAPPFT